MEYKIHKAGGGKSEIKLSLDKTEWLECVREAYEKSKHKFRMDGFRPGKVPFSAIEKRYGIEVFYDEAVDYALQKYYGAILDKEKDMEIVARPHVHEANPSAEGFTATYIVVPKPEFHLGKHTGLTIGKVDDVVTDADVDTAIGRQREQRARWIDAAAGKTATNGDKVVLDFAGSVDGVAFEGGSATGHELLLGSGSFIPGFEEQLVGLKVGEKKDVKVTFPKDYQAEHLAEKEAVFACCVNGIKIKELPALNDEFAKDISEFNSLAELKADLKAKMTEGKAKSARYEEDDKIINKIIEHTHIELADELVNEELDNMMEELEARMKMQNVKLSDYLKYMGTTVEKLREEKKADAEKHVKTRLVIEAIVKQEKLEITATEIEEKIAEIAKSAGKDVAEYKKTVKEAQFNRIANEIMSDKLFKFLRENNTIA